MKKLKIGQISPINLPVPPEKYGGTEKIIYWLCQELTNRGHQVVLFAAEDSKVKSKLCPILKKSLWKMNVTESAPYYAYEMAIVAKKSKELKLDILHDHLGPWSLALYGQVKTPIVHTLHVPMSSKDRIWVYKKLKAKLVSISYAQRKPAPNLNYVANIYNGIDLDSFPFNPKPKNHFIWVGELSPRKGILEVIKIAKSAKIKLVLIGKIPPKAQKSDYVFFKKYIEKELNKNNIKFLGEKKREELGKYYGQAKAFLFPLQWEEPFGLVMTESMASGTPVIAFHRGSVPEVIKDGETGFIVKNVAGAIAALKKIDQIERAACREHVKNLFSKEKMVDEYEKLYYKLLKK